MIILAQKYGQLGNRLAYLRSYISFALEYDLNILDLSFDEYSKHFIGTSNNIIRINNIFSCLLINIIQKLIYIGLIRENGFLLSIIKPDDNFIIRLFEFGILKKCMDGNVIIYDGWPGIDWKIVKRHDCEIRKMFSLVEEKAVKVKSFIEEARKFDEILVGIHIRQGDYKYWENGKHFFETKEYICIMSRILELHNNTPVKFIISSNETQEWELFSGFNYLRAPGDAVVDMYILAECDEIYGPQSSFTGWASFFGDVPLCRISNPRFFDRASTPME